MLLFSACGSDKNSTKELDKMEKTVEENDMTMEKKSKTEADERMEDSEEKIRNYFENNIAKDGLSTLYFIYDDYDGNGTKEAFAIRGKKEADSCTNVVIYYVDGENIRQMNDKEYYGYYSHEQLLETGKQKFLVWELDAGGSGSLSYVFGVKDGKSYQPQISGNYEFFWGEDNRYSGAINYFAPEGGHEYISKELVFDENTGEFVEDSTNFNGAQDSGLTEEEQYKINIFLSNFSEQMFGDYIEGRANEMQLVQFAFLHCKINSPDALVITSDGMETLTLQQVNDILKKYFGHSIQPDNGTVYSSDDGWEIEYKDGTFYMPGADGASYAYFSVANSMEQQQDGTYRVAFTIYSVDEYNTGGNIIENQSCYYLNPITAENTKGISVYGSGIAVVKNGIEKIWNDEKQIYEYKNVDTYQLLEYTLK